MTHPLRLLLVEDSPTDAKLVLHALRGLGRPIEHERVEDAESMLSALLSKEWDLILSDWAMPKLDAVGALRTLHQSGRDIPFIIVSGTIGEEAAVDAMRMGAQDYVFKDKLARLVPAIERELRESADRAARFEERSIAEAAARAEQARFRALVENSADGITLNRADGSFAYVSPAAARILGGRPEEVVGTHIADYVASQDRDVAMSAMRRIRLSPGASETNVHEVIRRDGTRRWVETTRTNWLDDPSVAGVVCNLRDITDRKRVEDALVIAERRFTALFESGIIGIHVADLEGTVVDANETLLALLGYTRDDLVSGTLDWRKTAPGEWEASNAESASDVRASGRSTPREKEYFRKDGTRVPVLVGMVAVEGSHVISVSVDLTERKRADDALRERMNMTALSAAVGSALTAGSPLRETLQGCANAIVDHLGAACARIWTLNDDKQVLDLEASAGQPSPLEELDRHVPVGARVIGRIAEERRAYTTNDVVKNPHFETPPWMELERIESFVGHPLIVSGELVGVLAIFGRRPLTDVTLTGVASIADALAVGIERRFVEGVKTSLEAQLRQAQKMEAVGRLAGGVAHDFNNMLSVILSYGELLLSDLAPGESARDDIEEIQKAAKRAAALTRQLLLFSRQQVIEPKVVRLNDLIADMDKMFQRILGEDVELVSITKSSVGGVLVDPSSMEQVVMNLVVNARDAMPTGGKLTIETANVFLDEEYTQERIGVKPGPYVMLAVTDTGVGMDKTTQAHIFEPFFTTKETGKGTGLGLSTVFGIVMQSGGTIWVYSEPEHGTSFKIYLPRVDADVDSTATSVAPLTLRGTETILLVEDEEQVRAVARGILQRYGYEVLEARSAAEALLLCETHVGTIQLLVSDVVMPQMSGPELAKRLSLLRPELKVLCMSGYTDESIVRHGVLEAHFAFLQKPIMPETLARKVREVLDARATLTPAS